MAETKGSTMSTETFFEWLKLHPVLAILLVITVGLLWVASEVATQNGWWRKK